MKPLLVCNTVPYRGPKVPLFGLSGEVRVEGMCATDMVHIHTPGRMYVVEEDSEFSVGRVEFARAERVRSSGSEVSIWVS